MFLRQIVLNAALFLALSAAPALADDTDSSNPDLKPFSASELIAGVKADEARCSSYATAVWVVVDGQPDCVRYFLAGETFPIREALVFLHGDFAHFDKTKNAFEAGAYASLTPDRTLKFARRLSLNASRPALVLARPGTMGSSGQESRVRHTTREARIISAALDAIKARYELRSFHIAGQSGGGGMTAAMVNMRGDVACAVIGSGDAAMFETFRDSRGPMPTGDVARKIYDASQHLKDAKPSGDLRVFVLTDPNDQVVSARSQTVYAQAAKDAGLPVDQIFTVGAGESHHGLTDQAAWVLEDCALHNTDTHIERGVRTITKSTAAVQTSNR